MGTFIIAEIGVNHNGSCELLKKLIQQASYCGADACKFQTFQAAKLASVSTPKARYQKLTSGGDESHFDMLKKLEMDHEMHVMAKSECEARNMEFISTPYDPVSVDYLKELGVQKIKTASADIVDHRIHKKIVENDLEPIVSLGMATYEEIFDMLEIYASSEKKPTLLHCVSNYPCSDESLNLNCIPNLRQKYQHEIGFSDHSIGNDAAVAAVCLGAKIIEKHFTIDKSLEGPDHKASSTPEEFSDLITRIRRIETMLGDGKKVLQDEELSMHSISRKSAVALRNIKSGELITEEALTMRRPGGGISGRRFFDLIDKTARYDIAAGERISWQKVHSND